MSVMTTRAAAKQLNMSQLDVIRRIRRGDIKARKMNGGWIWLIEAEEVERVSGVRWYVRLMEKRSRQNEFNQT